MHKSPQKTRVTAQRFYNQGTSFNCDSPSNSYCRIQAFCFDRQQATIKSIWFRINKLRENQRKWEDEVLHARGGPAFRDLLLWLAAKQANDARSLTSFQEKNSNYNRGRAICIASGEGGREKGGGVVMSLSLADGLTQCALFL